LVYAKTKTDDGWTGITAFVVEKDFPGFRVARKVETFGMRGSGTSELHFSECEVPIENVVGEVHQGTRLMMRGLDYERVVVTASPVGLMQAAMDVALPYARERVQFGQPIGDFQLMQGKLADMYAALGASRSYLYATAAAADRGLLTRTDAAAL